MATALLKTKGKPPTRLIKDCFELINKNRKKNNFRKAKSLYNVITML